MAKHVGHIVSEHSVFDSNDDKTVLGKVRERDSGRGCPVSINRQ